MPAKRKKFSEPHTCPYCEADIAEAAFPYCEACGLQVIHCPKCGMSIARGTEKCPNCGAIIKDEAAKGR